MTPRSRALQGRLMGPTARRAVISATGVSGAAVTALSGGSSVLAAARLLISTVSGVVMEWARWRAFRRYQDLYTETIRHGLTVCKTSAQTRELLADLAATHPEFLGTRLPYRPRR
ncbi:hypothetical protein ETD83_41365 [Actinomadura soli]|uniref:DUF4231 domain-containing protein n=1 Tax=Actinomadura soli TaxID=2508997 RepID=A0A5C4IY95_9ACTN|nr:hypothetical protein [Actinomadura soli]TMQ82080.1 hypothetical protein ETD83_41365 [Actinomadura soli]